MQRDDMDPDFDDPTDRPKLGGHRNRGHAGDIYGQPGRSARAEHGGEFAPDIPPLPANVPPLFVERDPSDVGAAPARAVLWPIPFAAGAIVIAGAVGLWIYGGWSDGEQAGEAPLILAEEGPEKVRPVDEGGLEVPNQDMLIYDEIGGAVRPAEPENLMPEPEAPLALPAPSQTSQPPEESVDTAIAEAVPGAALTESVEAPATEEDVDIPTVDAPSLESEPAAGADQGQAAVVQPQAVAEEQPAVQTAAIAGAYRVQLAAVKSEAAAKAAWVKLSKAHAEQLSGMSLRVEKVDRGADGVLYRVQAGPLADRAAAQGMCAQLKKKDQPCLVVAP